MPPRPATLPAPVSVGDIYEEAPPSYEDAMADNIGPVDGPRREYHPPDGSSTTSGSTMESGADAKSPVGEDGPAAAGTSGSAAYRENRSSSESFDMLPTTPPESPSPPTSPVARPRSTMKVTRNNPGDDESPPQYQPIADDQLQASAAAECRPSRPNLGVPSRKPVPRTSGGK